jgi:glycosyltransferase involved in cell wall biosynthesis
MLEMVEMKIFMICPFPFPSIGGAEGLAYELAKSLAEKNEVFIASLSSGYRSLSENKNLHVISNLKKGKIGFIKNFFIILKLLMKERPNVIHAHFVFPAAAWGITGKLFKVPVIVTSHGADIQKNKEIGYGARLNKVVALITWLTLKLIDVHVVVGKSMIKDAIEAGSDPSRVRIVYNGIDLKKISLSKGTNIFRRYGLIKNDFLVLYLGRLHPKKRPDLLVRAYSKVLKRIPNAKLILCGKGEERRKLEKLASDLSISNAIIFTGFVSEDEKWDLLKNCDVFVLPSIIEGHPITVMEAMVCGKPVIATNVGPFPEIIRDGETGVLVPVDSAEYLVKAIIDLALNIERRKEMGRKARKDVEKRFDIKKIAEDYLRIYKFIISKKEKCKK